MITRVQAFIPNWAARTCDALDVYARLRPHCPTQILGAQSVPFREQWAEALSKFTGDVMIWCMADCRPENWNRAYPAMLKLMERGDVGVWAPHLNQPSQLNGNSIELVPGVFEVATTNMICIAVTRRMLDLMPNVEMHPNGWLYDYLMTAVARRNGLKVVVDARFEARHTPGSIYDTTLAVSKMYRWLDELPDEWRSDVDALWQISK